MFRSQLNVCFALFLLLVSTPIFSVKVDEEEPSFNSFFNFYSRNLPSAWAAGRGYTGVAGNGDLSLSVINPAAVDLPNVWEVFYEYQSKDDIKINEYDQNLKYSEFNPAGTFGIGLKLNKIQAGIVYYQRNSSDFSTCIKCLFNDVQVDSMNYHLKATITDFSIPVNYQINDKFRLGASLILGKYESRDPAPYIGQTGISHIVTGKVDFNMIRFKMGFVASPLQNFSIGASFMPEAKRDLKKEYGLCYGCVEYSDTTFPTEFNAGLNYTPQALPLKILVDYNFSNDSVYEELKDRHDFNVGIEYMYKNTLAIRTGFFTQHDYRDLDYTVQNDDGTIDYWDAGVSYDQYFITGGFTLNWKRLSFNAALMNSSLLSKGDIEQTYFILGTSLNI